MSEPRNGWAQERALWRRWSAIGTDAAGEGPGGAAPDALTLAAFAEHRLSGPARAAVEAFLAANPEVAEDIAAARQAAGTAAETVDDVALAATIARAAALVHADNVVPFRPVRRTASPWPAAARWGALAASLAMVSWLGFALGSNAYGDLAALDRQSGIRLADELLDPPSGFFGLVDASGT